MKRWHAWLELARISNLPTVWTNVLAGWLLAGGAWHWRPLGWLLLGGSLLYTAGMILNDAMDVKFDREHRKERPIPSGRVSVSMAWSVGIGMLVAGAAMSYFAAGACGWLVLALMGAILLYDAFHKPWAGSVLIMGSCRALLYLMAGSAVTGGLSWEANQELVVKAVALGAYIVGVSLVARSESKPARVDTVSNVLGWLCLASPGLVALAIASLSEGHFRASAVIFIFGFVVWRAGRILRGGPPSVGRAVGWLLAGIVVVDALALGLVSPTASLFFVLSMPLLLLWQRKIAAT